MRFPRLVFLCALILTASMAQAQENTAFSGAYIGPEIGAVDHHFIIERSGNSGVSNEKNVTRWGVGGGVFAGYTLPITPTLLLGGETSLSFGGQTPRYTEGTSAVSLKPRWGYTLTGRAAYTLSPRTMLFVEAGYGAHRYKLRSNNADTSQIDNWTRSFVLGGGVEYALRQRLAIRARFQHLDGTRNQIMIGIPVRF